jgi:hypothetical protein
MADPRTNAVAVLVRELENQGVLALQFHSCCQVCGAKEAQAALAPHHKGFAFYDVQGASLAFNGEPKLYLTLAPLLPPRSPARRAPLLPAWCRVPST